jgi:uncharacterized protein YbbC (DUF1343 family)
VNWLSSVHNCPAIQLDPLEVTISRVRTGLDQVIAEPPPYLVGARIGLIHHQASVRYDLMRADELMRLHNGLKLAALFGPQHGVHGEKQDNMIESDSFVDPVSGVPVYSLYGEVRKPTPEMLQDLDVLVFDLQDVGVRVYTFVWTMVLAMEACRDAGVPFVVLDRPNPVGGILREGPVLDSTFSSFVGMHPIPLRHGLTAGEIAKLANKQFGIGCKLEVVPCEGWRRGDLFETTGLPFVMPSPNLPTLESCTVYPGMVLIEGTNLSEGRGTTKPFELVGAPYLNADVFADRLNDVGLAGVKFRACSFEPTFQKHADLVCGGVQVHVTDRATFRPVSAAVELLTAARELAPDKFAWRQPPYEYEQDKMPIDILWGGDSLRKGVDGGKSATEILESTRGSRDEFSLMVKPFLLYGD